MFHLNDVEITEQLLPLTLTSILILIILMTLFFSQLNVEKKFVHHLIV